jgi:hypothetical protein
MFRIRYEMNNMCKKVSPWSRVRYIFFMDRNRSKNYTVRILILKIRSYGYSEKFVVFGLLIFWKIQ